MKNGNMNIWIIADTHLGHDNMVKLCGRPPDFSERLMKSMSLIPPEDLLIHLGDVCFGNEAEWHKRISDEVLCRKWLLIGNHDKRGLPWYLARGWSFVGHSLELKRYSTRIRFMHVSKGEPDGLIIHGHSHNAVPYELRIRPNSYLLSCEYTNYQPTTLRTVVNEWRRYVNPK